MSPAVFRIKSDARESSGPLRAGVDFPTMAELNTLIDRADGRWRPFVVTAILTGMRLSELRGLTWADVDLDAGLIHVRRRANQWNNIGPPKSKAGKRDIPLAPIVVNTLRQWRLACPRHRSDMTAET
jgi:integrase